MKNASFSELFHDRKLRPLFFIITETRCVTSLFLLSSVIQRKEEVFCESLIESYSLNQSTCAGDRLMRGRIVPCKSFHSVNTSCQFSYFGLKSSTHICCYSAVAAKADIVCSVYVFVSVRIMFFRQMGLADELLHPCSNVKNCIKFSFLGKIVYETALCCLN